MTRRPRCGFRPCSSTAAARCITPRCAATSRPSPNWRSTAHPCVRAEARRERAPRARRGEMTSLAQVHDVGLGGATPLHVAALTADSELAAAELIARGAPVNAEDAWGATPLHCMVANRRMHGATAVLANGADVNRPLQATHTPPKSARADVASFL